MRELGACFCCWNGGKASALARRSPRCWFAAVCGHFLLAASKPGAGEDAKNMRGTHGLSAKGTCGGGVGAGRQGTAVG